MNSLFIVEKYSWIKDKIDLTVLYTVIFLMIYNINFNSYMWQDSGFVLVLRFPPPIKHPRYNWNIVESGVKHNKPNQHQK
jgi:hypothetical protein